MVLKRNGEDQMNRTLEIMRIENKHGFCNLDLPPIDNSYYYFDRSTPGGVDFSFSALGSIFVGCAINNFEFCERTVIDIWQFHEDLKSIKGAWR